MFGNCNFIENGFWNLQYFIKWIFVWKFKIFLRFLNMFLNYFLF